VNFLTTTQPGRVGTKHFEKIGFILNLYKLDTGMVFLRHLKKVYPV